MDTFLKDVVGFCASKAWLVVISALLLSVIAGTYLVRHFAIDTDTTKLISEKVNWRQRDAVFDAAFPQNDNQTVIVIDAPTPELAEHAAASLSEKLRARPDLFKTVRRPDGGDFFNRNGLLFMPADDVSTTMSQLIAGQPMLGSLAADPSMRGLTQTFSTYLLGVSEGDATLDDLASPLSALTDTLKTVVTGHPMPLSWRSLVTGAAADRHELRRFILVQPVLDFTSLSAGGSASDAIRQSASDLGLTAANHIQIRLTGPVPLADDELSTLADGAGLNALVTVTAVIFLLWLGLRSFKMITAIIATLAVGLVLTGAFGLALIGPFNLISVAFAVLFVGLGVDFGIQYCVRYREELQHQIDPRIALRLTSLGIGRQLTLAAVAIALGFFAFLPTDYLGVSELGAIAGTGMLIALLLNLTLLPALLSLLQPNNGAGEIGYRFLAPIDRLLINRRSYVLGAFAMLTIASLIALPWLRFDFNPLNLKSSKVESVATLLDLMKYADTSPNTIDILAASPKAAADLAKRLSALPEVDQVVSLNNFVPDDQPQKLAQIADASLLLGPTLAPLTVKPAPSDKDDIAAMQALANGLHQAAKAAKPTAKSTVTAEQLAGLLEQLAAGPLMLRDQARDALIPGLKVMLDQVKDSLQAQAVTLQTLPADLRHDWLTEDGRARLQVFPKGDSNDNDTLTRFSAAVRAIAPEATGAPISIQESGKTIVHAFELAALLAAGCITLLLIVILKQISDVLLTLTPLMLAGLLTLGTCVLIGQPINFANIIALPLLFGIGVAFNIYFVMAWRKGAVDLLQSSLTRAILFSALTTSTAFGSLWLSQHPGTASMGKLLVISLAWTLTTALIFLPALLGRPRQAGEIMVETRSTVRV